MVGVCLMNFIDTYDEILSCFSSKQFNIELWENYLNKSKYSVFLKKIHKYIYFLIIVCYNSYTKNTL